MKQDRRPKDWKRDAKEVVPDYATLVAVAVARQASSPTAQVIAAIDSVPARPVSLVELFGERHQGSISAASFNAGVAALLSPPQEK